MANVLVSLAYASAKRGNSSYTLLQLQGLPWQSLPYMPLGRILNNNKQNSLMHTLSPNTTAYRRFHHGFASGSTISRMKRLPAPLQCAR